MPHRLNMRVPADCEQCGWRPQHMFCNLAPAPLADFNTIGTSVSLPKGAVLFREGDPCDRVYILCAGTAKLSCVSTEGKTLNLKISLPGDVLGLSAAISNANYIVTAETLETTFLKVIPKRDFMAFLEQHGEASMHAARSLSDEYRSTIADARRLALSGSVMGRVANLLLDWGRSAACGDTEMRFNMVLSHEELSNFTGTTRETVTRTLSRMQKDDLIRITGIKIHILEPEKLAALARQ